MSLVGLKSFEEFLLIVILSYSSYCPEELFLFSEHIDVEDDVSLHGVHSVVNSVFHIFQFLSTHFINL